MNNEVRKLIKGLEPYDWEQRINKHGKRSYHYDKTCQHKHNDQNFCFHQHYNSCQAILRCNRKTCSSFWIHQNIHSFKQHDGYENTELHHYDVWPSISSF